MANDEERLVVLLDARIRDLERNMAKASGVTAKTYREMSLGSKRATKNMEQDMVRSTTRINQALAQTSTKIGAFGKAAIGGFVGGLVAGGVAGIVNQVREVASAVAEVGDQARMAGLSTKAFQEWKFVAEQARIPIDAITDGLKELQLRADEFAVTGKGSAAEAFQRLGLTPQEVKEKLKDPSELMLLLIERTRQMKDMAAGIRIFDELFGGSGGERMVALIEQGEQGTRAQIQAANDFGLVMDEDMIKKAADVGAKFNIVAMIVGTNLKGAIVDAADALVEFIQAFNGFEGRRDASLEESLATLSERRLKAEKEISSLQARRGKGELGAGDGVLGTSFGESTVSEKIADYEREMEAIKTEADMIQSVLDARRKVRNVPEITNRDSWKPPAYTAPADTGGKSSRSSAASAVDREREAVQDLIAELEEELRLVNQSDAVKRAAAATRQAGAAATDTERQKIVDLTEAIHKEEEARRRVDEQAQFYRDLTRAGIDDLTGALEQGKGLWEAMGDVAVNSLKRIADTLIDDVLDSIFKVNNAAGSNGGGGFLNGLFSLLGGLPGAAGDPWAGMRVRSFEGGGGTGPGARSGGLDGRGGFLAMLHPRETVTDHTRGGSAAPASAPQPAVSVVRIQLADGLKAEILQEAGRNSVEITRAGLVNFSRNEGRDMVQQVLDDPRSRG